MADRDTLGRRVRQVWIAWAERQPNPKPSWLVPYDDLDEADKEADRRIGSALWGDGFAAGVDAGIQAAHIDCSGAARADVIIDGSIVFAGRNVADCHAWLKRQDKTGLDGAESLHVREWQPWK